MHLKTGAVVTSSKQHPQNQMFIFFRLQVISIKLQCACTFLSPHPSKFAIRSYIDVKFKRHEEKRRAWGRPLHPANASVTGVGPQGKKGTGRVATPPALPSLRHHHHLHTHSTNHQDSPGGTADDVEDGGVAVAIWWHHKSQRSGKPFAWQHGGRCHCSGCSPHLLLQQMKCWP